MLDNRPVKGFIRAPWQGQQRAVRQAEPAVDVRLEAEVVTAANPEAAAADPDAGPVPFLGILVGMQYEAPFDIDFTLMTGEVANLLHDLLQALGGEVVDSLSGQSK